MNISYKNVASILGMSVLSLLTSATSAYALSYNESLDGDLPISSLEALKILVLEVGANTIEGEFSVGSGPNRSVDIDAFRFVIAPDEQLVSGQLEITPTIGNPFNFSWNLYGSDANNLTDSLIEFLYLLNAGSLSLTTTPGSGDYLLIQQGWSAPEHPSGAAYRFTLNVDRVGTEPPPVPEPASYALMLVGMSIVSFWTWRKKTVA